MTEAMEYEEQLGDEQFVDEAAEGYEEIDDIEEEGDIAADYLEELLDIADLDGVITASIFRSSTTTMTTKSCVTWWVATARCWMPCRSWCACPFWLATAPVRV